MKANRKEIKTRAGEALTAELFLSEFVDVALRVLVAVLEVVVGVVSMIRYFRPESDTQESPSGRDLQRRPGNQL